MNKTINELTEMTSLAADDEFVVFEDVSGQTKKMKASKISDLGFAIIDDLSSSLEKTYSSNKIDNISVKEKSESTNVNYIEFGNGVLIQWGKKTSGESSGTITFPKSFKNTNYVVTFGYDLANPSQYGANNTAYIASKSNGSFTFEERYMNKYNTGTGVSGGTAGDPFDWVAIGFTGI